MTDVARIGDVLAGKYRVEKILGIGGMGMVVAATHLELGQRVALKFMLPAAVENEEAIRRFLKEARAASSLLGEHVCRVLDLGRLDDGAPYIVMEHLQGGDLQSLMKKRGVLPIAEAVGYVLQACEGMAEAHSQGIVHRDLKPGNLFLTRRPDGSALIKVLDFGISKVRLGGIVGTQTDAVMGSPAYMAPEQMQSMKDVDQRADIWSLGVILYQLVTGRPPFLADTIPALCMRVMMEPPPPLESVRADLPDGFSDVVMTCLAKERDERYADVGELAEALAPFGGASSSSAVTRIASVLSASKRGSLASFDAEGTTQPVPLTPAKAVSGPPFGTYASLAGESMGRPVRRSSWKWLAVAISVAVAGAITLGIAVYRRGDDAPAPMPATPTANPPRPEITVSPLPLEQVPAAPAVSVDAAVAEPTPAAHKPAAPDAAVPHHRPASAKNHADVPARDASVGSAAPVGSAAGSTDDDDEWTHMQHDKGP